MTPTYTPHDLLQEPETYFTPDDNIVHGTDISDVINHPDDILHGGADVMDPQYLFNEVDTSDVKNHYDFYYDPETS